MWVALIVKLVIVASPEPGSSSVATSLAPTPNVASSDSRLAELAALRAQRPSVALDVVMVSVGVPLAAFGGLLLWQGLGGHGPQWSNPLTVSGIVGLAVGIPLFLVGGALLNRHLALRKLHDARLRQLKQELLPQPPLQHPVQVVAPGQATLSFALQW